MRFRQNSILLGTIFMLSGFVFSADAQSFHFSDQHENIFKSNPAAISQVENLAFQLTYRNQWPGNSDFVNYDGAAIISSERMKSSLGVYAFRDVQGAGVINQTGASLMYAYRTRISPHMHLSAGIMASFSQYLTRFSLLTFENPVPVADENYFHLDFSTGIEFQYREKARIGIALNNLGAFIPPQGDHLDPGISLSYIGRIEGAGRYSRSKLSFEPLVYTSLSIKQSELLFGTRINYENLYGGIYIRQNYLFHYDAAIILLGTRFGNAEMFYTYDINLSGVISNFTNNAAHEVTFLYNLQYKRNIKKKSKKRGAIKCPNI